MSLVLLNTLFDDPGKQWLAIGGALFLVVYFVIRPMARKKQDPLSRVSTPGSSMAKQRSVEREMSNLLVELSEMARQVTAQLDTRATKLELLIREADEKIETLNKLGAGNGDPGTPPANALPRPSSAEREALLQPPTPPPQQPVPAADARHAEIYALADQGRSPTDIASRLGRPSGEIELILALRQ